MEMEEFEEIIEEALKNMPANFREKLEKDEIRLLPRSRVPEVLQKKYPGSLVFGVFAGIPISQKSVFNIQAEPTRIELYKESFETAFNDKTAMEQQIIKTVIHEIGHYFGFSEEELRRNML